jgi:hypothetical protein
MRCAMARCHQSLQGLQSLTTWHPFPSDEAPVLWEVAPPMPWASGHRSGRSLIVFGVFRSPTNHSNAEQCRAFMVAVAKAGSTYRPFNVPLIHLSTP